MTTTIIHLPLTLWDANAAGDIAYDTSIVFRAGDPYAVTVFFPEHADGGRGVREFVFALSLLIDGFGKPCGEGLTRVEPYDIDDDYMVVTLPFDGVPRQFYAETPQVRQFVTAACRLVPLVKQRPVVLAELDRWLAGVFA